MEDRVSDAGDYVSRLLGLDDESNDPITEIRVCFVCDKQKPLEEFSPQHKGPLGRSIVCFSCSFQHSFIICGEQEKACFWCHEIKPLEEFYRHPQGKKGVTSHCKACQSRHAKNRRRVPLNKTQYAETTRRGWLKRKYRLTVEQYDCMVEKQGGVCAICGKPSCSRLCIDHNHASGEIRGLLCTRCNISLGVLEDEGFIKRATEYLMNYRAER